MARALRGLGMVVLLGAAAAPARAGEPGQDQAAARAWQFAEILEMRPLVERIVGAPPAATIEERLAHLELRQDALAELESVSYMIDSTLARLQREQFSIASVRHAINTRSNGAITTWNLAAVLVGSGGTIVGTAMQLGDETTAKVGDGIIITGAAAAAAFGIVALVRKERGRPPYPVETNLLAPLFGRTPTAESVLPGPIWRYLDTPLVGEETSFRQQLVERFAQPGPRVELLTRPISRSEVVPADVLEVRASMLDDLRTRVAAMKVDLRSLVRQVRSHTLRPASASPSNRGSTP